jgi:serine phosphatase RsbU (regulator of sigma subunit)
VESPELTETIVDLKPGDTFLLYTDGLFGSRKGKESRLNPRFLEKMLDHSAPSAEALLGQILVETAPSKAEEALPDDVAALAVRRTA